MAGVCGEWCVCVASGGRVLRVVGVRGEWWACVASGGRAWRVVGVRGKWWACVASGGLHLVYIISLLVSEAAHLHAAQWCCSDDPRDSDVKAAQLLDLVGEVGRLLVRPFALDQL